MTKQRKLRIGLVASAGGHLTQLRKLATAWSDYEVFWVTTTHVVGNTLAKSGQVHVVGECNRQQPFRVVMVFMRCLRIVLGERPDVVISTGAAAGAIICILSKLLGAKILWIDSITNVYKLSLSGRLVRRIADLFLVQWPELAEKYPGVEYAGAVI